MRTLLSRLRLASPAGLVVVAVCAILVVLSLARSS